MSDRLWYGHGVGFDANAERIRKMASSTNDIEEVRTEVDRVLEEMISNVDTCLDALENPMTSQSPRLLDEDQSLPDQSRRVVLSVGRQIDVAGVSRLNELLAAEGKIVNEAQKRAMPDVLRAAGKDQREQDTPIGEKSRMRPLHRFKALQEHIHGQTDQLNRRNATMVVSGPANTNRAFCERGTRLLEQFFAACRTPNDAEMFMLAEYLQVEVWAVFDWFKAKKAETGAYHLVLANSFSNNPQVRAFAWAAVQSAMVRQQTDLDFAAYCRKRRQMTREELQKKAKYSLEIIIEVGEMD